MRILFMSNAYKPTLSGVVTSVSIFRRGLINAGHEVSIIAPEYTGYSDDEPYVFRFPALDLTGRVDLSLVIPFNGPMERTVIGIKPQVIHSQHPVVMGSLASSFSRDLGIPLVFTFHTRYEEYTQKFLPIMPELTGLVVDDMVSRYLDHCTHVIAPTPSIRELIREKYPYSRPISVVPTPIDLSGYQTLSPETVRTRLGFTDEEMLLFTGRLSNEKNLELLLWTFQKIVEQRPNTRLVLVGKGPAENALRSLAGKLGISSQVLFIGPVEHEDIPNFAAAADLFLFPSSTETQGLVLIESMAAGTPVVAVTSPSSQDVLEQGGGILVDPDPDLFAATVVDLLSDPDRLYNLRSQARMAASRYDLETATRSLIQVYQQAIEDGPCYPMSDD
jgi:glycosyltransferase involved in cell wall biosynthesis